MMRLNTSFVLACPRTTVATSTLFILHAHRNAGWMGMLLSGCCSASLVNASTEQSNVVTEEDHGERLVVPKQRGGALLIIVAKKHATTFPTPSMLCGGGRSGWVGRAVGGDR